MGLGSSKTYCFCENMGLSKAPWIGTSAASENICDL